MLKVFDADLTPKTKFAHFFLKRTQVICRIESINTQLREKATNIFVRFL